MLFLCDFVNYFSCYCQRVDKTVSRIVSLGLAAFRFCWNFKQVERIFRTIFAKSERIPKKKNEIENANENENENEFHKYARVCDRSAVLFVLSESLSDIS